MEAEGEKAGRFLGAETRLCCLPSTSKSSFSTPFPPVSRSSRLYSRSGSPPLV